jgi:hypothetical protein
VKAISIADTWATASHEPLFRCAQHNHKCEHLSKNIWRVPAQFITRSQESLLTTRAFHNIHETLTDQLTWKGTERVMVRSF